MVEHLIPSICTSLRLTSLPHRPQKGRSLLHARRCGGRRSAAAGRPFVRRAGTGPAETRGLSRKRIDEVRANVVRCQSFGSHYGGFTFCSGSDSANDVPVLKIRKTVGGGGTEERETKKKNKKKAKRDRNLFIPCVPCIHTDPSLTGRRRQTGRVPDDKIFVYFMARVSRGCNRGPGI